MIDPAASLAIIHARYGRHSGCRALHAKGTWCAGTFTAAPAAAALSPAAHLQGDSVPVRARLSNGSGHPGGADHAPDVRGLAVSFLVDGGRTDIVAQSVPRFAFQTPDEFMKFIAASTGRSAAWRLPLFLATHPRFLRSMPVNAAALRPVASYATCRFYGVHAFRWLDAAGGSRYVRYEWVPVAGHKHFEPARARSLGRDYLQKELAHRVAAGAARWRLEVQVAAPGDDVDDPSQHWPPDRPRVNAGTLELTAVEPDPETSGGPFVFDPVRVTDGIEASDDPVLRYRPRVYSESVERRSA